MAATNNVTGLVAAATGSHGFASKGFVLSAMLRQIGFKLGQCVMREVLPQRVTPVLSEATLRALGEDKNDNGQPIAVVLNKESLVDGYAAAFRLLRNHIKEVNPETGRKDEHLLQFLQEPIFHINKAAEYSADTATANNIKQTLAQATMMYGKWEGEGDARVVVNIDEIKEKCAKRIAAIEAESKKLLEVDADPVNKMFIEALQLNADEDTESLVMDACEALSEAGEDPVITIKRAAQAFLDSQKKRLEEGLFVKIDGGIFALTQLK